MQNQQTDRYTSSANQYSPSVPISVYRELAAELQTSKATIESLKSQNQQLVKQNQQLRQEIEKVVQTAQHLQDIVTSLGSVGSVNGVEGVRSRASSPPQPEPRPASSAPPPPRATSVPISDFPHSYPPTEPTPPPYAETLVIEQEEPRPRRSTSSDGISEVNGWWLIAFISIIVLTAFGAGFWIVRTMLNNNNR